MAVFSAAMVVVTILATIYAIFRWPELGLVLCVVAGPIAKGSIQPYLGPVDLTLALFSVTALAGAIRVRSPAQKLRLLLEPTVILAVALVSLLGISILWTPSRQAGLLTLARFVVLDFGLFGMTFLYLSSQDRVRHVTCLFAWIGCSMGALLLLVAMLNPYLNIVELDPWRALPLSASPIGVGWILGIAILLALGHVLSDRPTRRTARWLLYALMLVATVELTALNTRGPLFATGIGVAFFGLIGLKRFSFQRLARYLPPILISVILAYVFLPEIYTFRYEPSISLNAASTSVVARTSHWTFVRDHFAEWWIGGVGLAGYASVYLGREHNTLASGAYPHNLFLDLFTHAGLGAVFLMGMLIVVQLRAGLRSFLRAPPLTSGIALAVVASIVLLVVASQFSMSLLGTRLLWLLFGIVAAGKATETARALRQDAAQSTIA